MALLTRAVDTTSDQAGQGATAVVVLACKGGMLGRVVNQRYLVVRCRNSWCKIEGEHSFHIFDLLTGQMTTHRTDPIPAGILPEGEQDNAIR